MSDIPGGPRHLLVRANSLRLPVASGSVHAVVTSSPYYQLRKYGCVSSWPACSYSPMPGLPPIAVPAMEVELGLEPSIDGYIAHLMLVMDELWRVLRADGSVWWNLSDSYNNASSNQNKTGMTSLCEYGDGSAKAAIAVASLGRQGMKVDPDILRVGSLLGIPWRFAFAAQAGGWTLRAAPPWIKPGSAMPESCTSRPNVAHEMIFMLTKSDRYYFDMESVRRSSAPSTLERDRYSRVVQAGAKSHIPAGSEGNYGVQHDHETVSHPNGRHWRTSDLFLDSLDSAIAFHAGRLAELEAARAKGGLLGAEGGAGPEAFLINPQSYAGSHFAAFPTKLVRDMIKCSTSEYGVCQCGAPYERAIDRPEFVRPSALNPGDEAKIATGFMHGTPGLHSPGWRDQRRESARFLGWRPTCSCPAGTPIGRPVVLDPFSGSGVTVAIAEVLGRQGIGIDLSKDYHQLASDRVDRPHKPQPRRPRPGRPAATLPGFGDDEE